MNSATGTAHHVVAVIGPPGAGKTTLARRLAWEYSMVRLSSGDLLRSILHEHSPAGDEARRRAAAEAPGPPDATAQAAVLDALTRHLPDKDVLLEGFPRTLSQSDALDRCIAAIGGRFSALILIDIAEPAALQRVRRRLVCEGCGAVAAALTTTLRQCDACGLAMVRRAGDDRPEIMRRRVFYDRDAPSVIRRYRGRGCLARLDGGQAEQHVFQQACEAMATFAFTRGGSV